MDRKDFLKTIGKAGVATGTLAVLGGPCCCFAAAQDKPATGQKAAAKGTPCEERLAFADRWTKRFFDAVDAELDEPTRTRFMEANGRACYRGSRQGQPAPKPVSADAFVADLQKYVGKENARQEGNTVYFNYVANPAGLKVSDGYCLCPLVETGPKGLSGTFCTCSVGYVREMFSQALGKSVQVELLESLKRGGKACRFKVALT